MTLSSAEKQQTPVVKPFMANLHSGLGQEVKKTISKLK